MARGGGLPSPGRVKMVAPRHPAEPAPAGGGQDLSGEKRELARTEKLSGMIGTEGEKAAG